MTSVREITENYRLSRDTVYPYLARINEDICGWDGGGYIKRRDKGAQRVIKLFLEASLDNYLVKNGRPLNARRNQPKYENEETLKDF